MLRLTFLTCCVLLLTGCGSDESESVCIYDVAYESPVDYDITLAGNFGEPRPFHFHGGIDVKYMNQVRFSALKSLSVSSVRWMLYSS